MLSNILIFGNSGSGKSTLAKRLCQSHDLAHLDLDTLAWQPTFPPERKSLKESAKDINNFIKSHEHWVIEGCYTDLLKLVEQQSSEIIFMNLPIKACISNAKSRPWEPHKYESKAAQDQNLAMLVGWIEQYTERNDTFSEVSHLKFYDNYSGRKRMVTRNETHVRNHVSHKGETQMHLAQLNIAKAKYPLDAPEIKEFMDNLVPVNKLAEQSDGFIWRLEDESGDATSIHAFSDPNIPRGRLRRGPIIEVMGPLLIGRAGLLAPLGD